MPIDPPGTTGPETFVAPEPSASATQKSLGAPVVGQPRNATAPESGDHHHASNTAGWTPGGVSGVSAPPAAGTTASMSSCSGPSEPPRRSFFESGDQRSAVKSLPKLLGPETWVGVPSSGSTTKASWSPGKRLSARNAIRVRSALHANVVTPKPMPVAPLTLRRLPPSALQT